MSDNSTLKTFQRTIARYFFVVSRSIIKFLPYPLFRIFSFIFIPFGYLVMGKKKKLAMDNLREAFGNELSEKEIKQIMKKCFKNIGRGMVDLIYFLDRPKRIVEMVDIEGKEHLDAALKEGKGVIILSAHLGIFILMYLRIIQEGYTTNVIMRRTRDEEFEEIITGFRTELGIRTVYALPQRKCIQESITALRNNQLLFILLDQNYGSDGGVFVNFFGKKAATAAGPAVFSSRTDAPILPMFIVRQTEEDENGQMRMTDRHKIIIEPPISLTNLEAGKDAIPGNIQVLSDKIEEYVRKFPYEWGGWMHQRWKTQYKK